MPYKDRPVIEHKERELQQICYRIINGENETTVINSLNGEDHDGRSDFDLNSYLAEHIPNDRQIANQQNTDRIGQMIGQLNETDRRILNLMDYYEKL